jgi:PhnB protein
MNDAAKAIRFYQEVFGATELARLPMPDGKVGHAEIQIGDSRLMLADEFSEWDARSAQSLGGSPVIIHLYVEDVDVVVGRAVAAGAQLFKAVADQFYGDRTGSITDPFGHKWTIATHKEDVSPEETMRRAAALFGRP